MPAKPKKTRLQTPAKNAAAGEGVMLWRQIADNFEYAIAEGRFGVGDRLPAETDIAGQYRVNRHTVRRALAELAERGLVKASRGSGTFVEKPKLDYPIGQRTRFSENISSTGLEAGGRLIAYENEPAGEAVARMLKVPVGTMMTKLEIVRTAGRIPICSTTKWVSAEEMPDAAKIYRGTQSVTKMLAHFGITDYRRDETRITATLSDSIDARRLRIGWHQPILVVESVDVTTDGRPLIASRSRFTGDRLALVVKN